MKIKLLINGEDKRISIEPENRSDKKLLEFINEHDAAEIFTRKTLYDRDIEKIELKLFTKPEEQFNPQEK